MVKAFLGIKTCVDYERDVKLELDKRKEVKESYLVYGPFDIFARIEVSNLEELGNFVRKLKYKDGVDRVQTYLIMEKTSTSPRQAS